MSKSVYVFSTLSSGVAFAIYEEERPNDLPRIIRKVLIKGGANIADRKTLITPKGVVTEITEDDLALLRKQCPSFKRHEKRGYLKVEEKKYDPEKVAEAMPSRDDSSPITPEDMVADGKKPGTTAEIKTDDDDTGLQVPAAGAKKRGRGRPKNEDK